MKDEGVTDPKGRFIVKSTKEEDLRMIRDAVLNGGKNIRLVKLKGSDEIGVSLPEKTDSAAPLVRRSIVEPFPLSDEEAARRKKRLERKQRKEQQKEIKEMPNEEIDKVLVEAETNDIQEIRNMLSRHEQILAALSEGDDEIMRRFEQLEGKDDTLTEDANVFAEKLGNWQSFVREAQEKFDSYEEQMKEKYRTEGIGSAYAKALEAIGVMKIALLMSQPNVEEMRIVLFRIMTRAKKSNI